MILVGISIWMSLEVSKWLGNGLFHLLIIGIYWEYNPLILTFDPNFQRDIQVINNNSRGLFVLMVFDFQIFQGQPNVTRTILAGYLFN